MKKSEIKKLYEIAEVQLSYKKKNKQGKLKQITTSQDAYDILINSWDKNKIDLVEQFKILLLNRSNECIGLSEIASGGNTHCIADPKIVFSTALKAMACGIILSHNHPSGNLKPSKSDHSLTKKFIEAGELLEINVLDHLVITRDGYTSFADGGDMPTPS